MNKRRLTYYFFVLPLAMLAGGCVSLNKQLKPGEKQLRQLSIEAHGIKAKYELRELLAQKPNQRFPFQWAGVPALASIYYLGERNYDKEKIQKRLDKKLTRFDAKIEKARKDKKKASLQYRKQKITDKFNYKLENGNTVMQWGEPLAVFDSTKHALTIERFRSYLFNHGYFNNRVESMVEELDSKGRKVWVKFEIFPGEPYMIDTVIYRVNDTTIYNFITDKPSNGFVRQGQKYNQENFTKERDRIDALLKDNGYYDFSKQYIEFEIDTTYDGHHKIAVLILIREPAKRGYHKRFKVEEVNFTTDAGKTVSGTDRTSKRYRNIQYKSYQDNYNTKILTQRVFVVPGDFYSRTKTFNTQRQLANLDNFKFVNVNYDTSGGSFIANIYTSPLDRYQWSNEIGVSVTQGFPGPFYNINFKKRNIFNGLENFEMNGRVGFEGVASATSSENIYRSTEAGVNAAITFPQFLWPFGEENKIRLGRLNPHTKAQVGYNYTNRPEYKRSATTVNFTYSWENQRIRRFDFTLASLSIINSEKTQEFSDLLDSLKNVGNNLYLTFNPSFVSSMIFSMSWNHNNYGNTEESSVFFKWSLESGGTLQNFVQYPLVENRGLQSFKYFRVSADIRRNAVLGTNGALAYRFNAGLGYSYDTEGALPYEKYFFAGGSNSVRAWRPRRLGPGSFRPSESTDPDADGLYNYRFEQPGDILIEGSVEVRRKLIGFLEGALFLDAGNVWTRLPRGNANEIDVTGNSQFKIDQFYKEFGIGTGFGLRFNFSFLILRFDAGIKVYDPARPESDRFVLDNMKFVGPFGVNREPVIYNVGIGYPF